MLVSIGLKGHGFAKQISNSPAGYLATPVSVMESPLTVPALAGSTELLMRMLELVKQDVKQIFWIPCITIRIPHRAVCLKYT